MPGLAARASVHAAWQGARSGSGGGGSRRLTQAQVDDQRQQQAQHRGAREAEPHGHRGGKAGGGGHARGGGHRVHQRARVQGRAGDLRGAGGSCQAPRRGGAQRARPGSSAQPAGQPAGRTLPASAASCSMNAPAEAASTACICAAFCSGASSDASTCAARRTPPAEQGARAALRARCERVASQHHQPPTTSRQLPAPSCASFSRQAPPSAAQCPAPEQRRPP
jgi:hypothetical protein